MEKPKEIKLPYKDFVTLLDTLEDIDTSCFDDDLKARLKYVLNILEDKRKKLDIRHAYSNIVFAKDEEEKKDAKMEYLRRKNSFYED